MLSSRPIAFTSKGLPLNVKAVLRAMTKAPVIPRKGRGQTVRHAVGEIVLLRIAAEIGERQDDDRKTGRLPTLGDRQFRPTRLPEGWGPLCKRRIASRALVWASTLARGRLDSDGRLLLGRQRLRQPVEAIALAGHGDDQSGRLRIGLDLFPQPPDKHVDAAVERLEAPVGERVQQSVAADDPPWPGDEHPQESKLAAGERDHLPGFVGQHAGVKIEGERGEAHER